MTPRALLCYGLPSNTLLAAIQDKTGPSERHAKDPNSKTQLKKMKKLEVVSAKKALKAREKGTNSTATPEVAAFHAPENQM